MWRDVYSLLFYDHKKLKRKTLILYVRQLGMVKKIMNKPCERLFWSNIKWHFQRIFNNDKLLMSKH